MKRIFALAICLIFAAVGLCACGDDDIYRQPGNGTTLGDRGNAATTTEPISDDTGSYSADPEGEVSKTTDGLLEEGMEDLEDGMNDIENGIDQGMDDVEDMMDGDMPDGADNGSTVNGAGQGTGNGATNGNAH